MTRVKDLKKNSEFIYITDEPTLEGDRLKTKLPFMSVLYIEVFDDISKETALKTFRADVQPNKELSFYIQKLKESESFFADAKQLALSMEYFDRSANSVPELISLRESIVKAMKDRIALDSKVVTKLEFQQVMSVLPVLAVEEVYFSKALLQNIL